jgi:uncharacterized SAM-binding protein YcdF (DUF218 family)
VLAFVFVAGFLVFASLVTRPGGNVAVRADGIVVVTGGQHRLVEASRLLAEGRGSRLLVSGANRQVSREDIQKRSGLDAKLFEKVDIGYEALDTIGNADETRDWARSLGFTRLIVVTSAYHMPRTLTELGRAMPEVALIPHRVLSSTLHTERWWMHMGTARILLSEYVKFLPSVARLGVSRLARIWGSGALAEDSAGPEPVPESG